MISQSGKSLYLSPVRANYGIELAYRRRLDALIDEMANSLLYWIGAAYRANEPELAKLAADGWRSGGNELQVSFEMGNELQILAADASPSRTLLDVIRRLTARWQRRFDQLAPELARWFSVAAKDRSDVALRAALRKAGFTVKFQTTRAVNDVLQASIAENVGLIKSIPAQYLTQVEGLVMRSVQQGRNLGPLAAELQTQFGVTKRRAALIARDQNNKATAVIARTRQQELGITQARWVHSHAGREPRPSHVKAGRDRVIFKLAEGWYDPDVGKEIWPGELINCRCTASPIIPGFG